MKKISEITRSVEVNAIPDLCYAVICDIPSYPAWFKHVKDFTVKVKDSTGRPVRVLYTFDLAIKKGIKTILDYEYYDAERKLVCTTAGGDIVRGLGQYEFRDLPEGKTLFVFTIKVDFGMRVPDKIVEFLTSRVLDDFMLMVKGECERRMS